MKVKSTPLKNCYIIEPTVFEDDRGYFYEKFNEQKFEQLTGMNGHFVQDNVSKSSYGVLRGLHLQKGDMAQAKLVSCLELSAENRLQFYIPRGFAHGFSVLSPTAVFTYKCDNFYNKESEGGIIWNDAELGIDWKLPMSDIILSEKDKVQKTFQEKDF